ncbi:uncharacterized protein FOKN1_0782 [Thiohalobacter thiocyanaticus]|uniref:VanZ-like domain-containing protein n=1 Tax=Thiohalobacter thiocyanaticus TaxID=585455 RepID=A0A1Z4VPM6_9GAMM|nr:VanZ family protein [Thiohalobacter thiocyanaticus]BAZ93184.1 uncharacterized protein FOKN1_0782 [Thiohalobacter thiocyanaticus]
MLSLHRLAGHPAVRLLSLVLALVWMGVLYLLSDQPAIDAPMLFPGQDKLFHAIVYAVLGGLYLALFRPGPAGYAAQARWLALGLAVLYGISDEWHQSFVPGREPDVLDVLADGVGAAVGVMVLHTLVRRLST